MIRRDQLPRKRVLQIVSSCVRGARSCGRREVCEVTAVSSRVLPNAKVCIEILGLSPLSSLFWKSHGMYIDFLQIMASSFARLQHTRVPDWFSDSSTADKRISLMFYTTEKLNHLSWLQLPIGAAMLTERKSSV